MQNFDDIFAQAVEAKASDIHFAVGAPPILRINGPLHPMDHLSPITQEDISNFLEKNLSISKKEEFAQNKELDFSYVLPVTGIRLRVNAFWEKGNLSLAARIIWPHIPTLEEIGMPPIIYELLKLKQGLIIITGAAGTGKSTTLAAIVDYLNENIDSHIITMEDPIEFVFQSKKSIIAQRELGQDTLSFSSALKHVVRQDPNIIMVGEMRDLETISTVLTLAETGHLILATLHTPSASQTISRIIDVFPSNQQSQIKLQLSLALKGIFCQQLLPSKQGGRIAAREVLTNTPAISNLIRENQIQQIPSTIQTGATYGMCTMEQSIQKLYKAGLIDEEIYQNYKI